DKYVCSGLENPEDVKCELESKWSFRVGDIQLNMKKNREKSLAFARMIGFILTDGSIYRSKNRKCIEAYFGTNIDATIFNHDMELLCGRTTTISRRLTDPNTARGVKGNTFRITLPASLAKDIHSIDGIVVGKRSTQAMMLPSFLLDKNCPLAIIREFLGGLFGGDGVAPCLSNGRFGRISFKWTTIEKHKSSMQNVFEQIALLLQRFGLETILHTPTKVKYGPNSIQPKDSDENPRWDYQISISSNDILKFQTCIGFRYCVNKSYRLTIVSSYQRMTELTRQQHADVLKQTLERSKTSTVPKALEESRKNVFLEQPVINEYSLSSVRDVYYQRHEQIRHADKPRKLSLQPKKFPSLKSYLIETNTLHWFGRKTYSVGPLDTHIPTYRRKVIDVRPNGIEKVYDIEVTDTHNFLANGVVAHNCSLYPTTIIAYNICWSTLVRDDKVPDDLCHIMEWEDHIGCVHDPKEIRKAEITKQLKVKEDELKEVRRQKALKTNKNRQDE
ncbi:MAG: hypothetical protein JSS09_07300, partial [Verrucomicrobia bacterium]|nr:hypothetical protein [Verrucomicrobiota bacterium]